MKVSHTVSFTHFTRVFLLLIGLLPACPNATSSTRQVIINTPNGDPIHVSVEGADTPEKRQLGLMYRNELPEMSGMLFLFPQETQLNFWMKNTPLPLDIIYISTDFTIVHIAENTTPYSTAQIPSKHPAKYVLEVNGGFCKKRGITSGFHVEITNVVSPLL